ncbi:MAG: helix-turn-helix transcriptional regulator [Clostridia bacterium]|nr:helix-turn-helix transcriptional regulator [Clostridia bacterium]
MTLNDAVAKRVVKLLREKKMTNYRLERKSGILHGALDRILNGQNKTVTLTTIYKLARGFEMSYMEFLDDEVFRSELLEID